MTRDGAKTVRIALRTVHAKMEQSVSAVIAVHRIAVEKRVDQTVVKGLAVLVLQANSVISTSNARINSGVRPLRNQGIWVANAPSVYAVSGRNAVQTSGMRSVPICAPMRVTGARPWNTVATASARPRTTSTAEIVLRTADAPWTRGARSMAAANRTAKTKNAAPTVAAGPVVNARMVFAYTASVVRATGARRLRHQDATGVLAKNAYATRCLNAVLTVGRRVAWPCATTSVVAADR